MKARLFILGLSAILFLVPGARVVSAQAPGIPQLEVLQKYIGEWGTVFTLGSGKPGAEETAMRGQVTTKWVLGDRFVEQTIVIEGEKGESALTMKSLLTFDPASGEYRTWSFTSGGDVSESRGKWDAESATFTFKGSDSKSGQSTTVTATFKGEDEEHWSIATEDSSGKLVGVITGKNTRIKKK